MALLKSIGDPTQDFLNLLNTINLETLKEALDELDEKAKDIFSRTGSNLDSIILREIENKNDKFFVWFCFLRANFLRGRDITSSKAFKQFIDFCKEQGNNFYFDKFPSSGNFLPKFKSGFQQARSIEEVLQQLRGKYNSGCEFVKEIEKLVDCFEIKELHKLYLAIIAKFMSFKQIGSKIANAILNEVAWELTLLKDSNRKAFQNLLKNEWIRKLVLASFFNVMIDTHVKTFFEEKLNIKNVEHSILIFMGKSVKSNVVRFLFERNFGWIGKKTKDFLLTNYKEYIGANMIEKLIWTAYFVKKNSRKNDNISSLQFFKLTGNLFL